MNMDLPIISIIMPAFKAEKYINFAIESILLQTYKNWELIIISEKENNEPTNNILKKYSDKRIKIIVPDERSGSPYAARKIGFDCSKGEYIICVDADDYIEESYLSKLYNRLMDTKADFCGSQMVVVDSEGKLSVERPNVPVNDFDFNQIVSGRKAFFYTVPHWIIGMNGCLCKRSIWEKAIKRTEESGRINTNTDEVLSRYVCLFSEKVSFCKCSYYYRMNESSLTNTFGWHAFDTMDARSHLLNIISKDYGIESEELKAVRILDFSTFHAFFGQLIQSIDSIKRDELIRYLHEFKNWHNRIDFKLVKTTQPLRYYYSAKNFSLYLLIRLLQYRRYKELFFIGNTYLSNIFKCILKNKYEKWFIERAIKGKKNLKIIKKSLSSDQSELDYDNCIINMFDGRVPAGGLADRLRGILSTYSVCKQKGLKYKLYFDTPFILENYLEPNTIDWRIKKEEISNSKGKTYIVVLDAVDSSNYHLKKQKQFLMKQLSYTDSQTLVFTNAQFVYEENYSELFLELFKPTKRLQENIDKHKKILNEKYISVSCRFMDLLGDFNETCSTGVVLSNAEKNYMISKCIWKIQELHNQFPSHRILVNSDSESFLKRLSKFDYIYVIPGVITHIDAEQDQDTYERYEKTFLDFFMIAGAERIYLLKMGKMFNSGYPFAASKLYNKQYEIIDF